MTPAAQPSSPLPEDAHADQALRPEAPVQEIEYAPAVMETIRSEAVSGLMRLGRGGIEVGGLLFGRNTPEALRILAVRPLDCEHRFGPSFILSDRDEDRLRLMLQPEHRDEETRDLEPVGWYVSHCRRKFSLEDSDIRVFDRYFPLPGSVTLIVMPDKIKPTRACFFMRDPETKVKSDVPSCEVLLPSPVDLALAGPTPVLSQTALPPREHSMAMQLAPLHTAVAASDTREIAARRLQTFLNQQEKHRKISTWNLWATVAVLLVCLAGAGYLWMRSNDSEAPAIPLRVSDAGAQIRIQWDTKLKSVETASSGVLQLTESDGTSENVILQPQVLRAGSAFYSRRTDKVEIRLKLLYPDRPAFESMVYFIHPLAVANTAAPAQEPSPSAPVAEPPKPADSKSDAAAQKAAEVARAEQAKADQAKAEQAKAEQARAEQARAQQAKADQAKADQAKADQARADRAKLDQAKPDQNKTDLAKVDPSKTDLAKADRAKTEPVKADAKQDQPKTDREKAEKERVERLIAEREKVLRAEKPRTFQPPVQPSRTVASNIVPTSLPTPTSTPAFQPPAVNLGTQPVIAPPPPAPTKPVVAAKKEAPRARSGRLIWTGELGRNALLTLNASGASQGWTNGRLPGAPVRVSVHVAELVAGGMEVYSDDPKRPASAEAPNAENGWNTVVYKADAKRLGAEVQIIEAPSASNSWGQLVLRNGKRPVSVLVIDWQLN